MPFPVYKNTPVDCTTQPDTNGLKGKSVIVTGGASGMGEQGVRAFAKAGAFVTFGDINEEVGKRIEAELGSNVKFVPTNVASWESQEKLFQVAKSSSPHQSVDVVIACAGITGADPVFYGQDGDKPIKPDLKILDVNLNGAVYTLTLARHYFLKNTPEPGRDRCFIIFSSLAGYADVPGGPLYMASKFAARALMRCIRRTTVVDGIRANALAPWYVKTNLMHQSVLDFVTSKGGKFAEASDAADALLKVAADESINGRCFTIVPRDEAPLGYYDMELDDYAEGSRAQEQQDGQLRLSHRLQGFN